MSGAVVTAAACRPPGGSSDPGPLAGRVRLATVGPFALPAIGGAVLLALDPDVSAWGMPAFLSLTTAAIVTAFLIPWRRLPRPAQQVPAYLYMGGIVAVLVADQGGVHEYLPLAVLPLLWLAMYESCRAIAVGMVAAIAGAVAATIVHWPASRHDVLHESLLVAIALGVIPAVARLVAEVHRRAQDQATLAAAARASLGADLEKEVCAAARALTGADGALLVRGDDGHAPVAPDDTSGMHWAVLHSIALQEGPPVALALGFRDPGHQVSRRAALALDALADVTAMALSRQYAATELRNSERRFRELADRGTDVTYRLVLEPLPRFEYVSPSIEAMTGYPSAAFLADPSLIDTVCHPDDQHFLWGGAAAVPSVMEMRWRRADGTQVVTEHHVQLLPDGHGIQGVARDVTEVRRLQHELAEQALHDPLTGLANRRLLEELVGPAIARAGRRGESVAIAFLDLDRFKEVNDTHGHDAGDDVLVETANRLRACVRSADIVARIGGDEFVVVLDSPRDDGVAAFVQRVTELLEQPIDLEDGTTVSIGASIGVADTLTAGGRLDALLDAADAAMYAAKRGRQAAYVD